MPTTFSPTTGSFITLSEATTMTSAWATLQGTLGISITEANPKAIAFGIDNIMTILNQEGCKGFRIYNGYAQSKRNMIIVGVDENGDDMTSGSILELGTPCPQYCAPSTSIA